MDTVTSPNIEALASRVQLCKKKVADYKRGFLLGHLAYEDLAEAGRELSDALFEYSRIKFPNVKPRRLPYQSIIR